MLIFNNYKLLQNDFFEKKLYFIYRYYVLSFYSFEWPNAVLIL